jgi:hypothetical protein
MGVREAARMAEPPEREDELALEMLTKLGTASNSA